MCTIGAVRFPDGAYALFKNKDFNRVSFDDRITVERGVFGVAGLATWAAAGGDADVFSGFSIAANSAGLLCADANVGPVPGGSDCNDLVEFAVREAHDVPEAITAVERAVAARPYHRANLVLIDASETAVVEVDGDRAAVLRTTGSIARTNHHTSTGPTPGDDNTTTTVPRLRVATEALPGVESIADVHGSSGATPRMADRSASTASRGPSTATPSGGRPTVASSRWPGDGPAIPSLRWRRRYRWGIRGPRKPPSSSPPPTRRLLREDRDPERRPGRQR